MTTYDPPDTEYAALKGKTIVIVGGVQGIGRGAVDWAHKNGANVVLGDWKEDLGGKIEKALKERILFLKTDVSKWDNVLDLFEAAHQKYGVIHAAICNAGIAGEDYMDDKIDAETGRLQAPDLKTIEVNLNGVLYVVKCALHYFAKWPDVKCQMVMTSSAASFIDTPNAGLYCASKCGVLGLLRGLRTALVSQGRNATINMVAPWATDTPMLQGWIREVWHGLPMNEPKDVARALLLPVIRPEINGKSFWVGEGEIIEVEDKTHELQPVWLTKEMSAKVDEGQRRIVPGWEEVVMSYKKGVNGVNGSSNDCSDA